MSNADSGSPSGQAAARAPRGRSVSRASLHPLLLLTCGLLVAVVLVLTGWSYSEVRAAFLAMTTARLESAVHELEPVLADAAAQNLRSAERVATSAPVVEFVRSPGDATRAAVEDVITSGRSRRSGPPATAEVWGRDGTLLGTWYAPAIPAGEPVPPLHEYRGSAPTTTGVQSLLRVGDAVYLEVVTPVPASADDRTVAGHVVLRRGLFGGRAAELLGRIIGPHAILLLGTPGGAWTDLNGLRPEPPLAAIAGAAVYPNAAGEERIAAAFPIHGTPWTLVVEDATAATLAPAHRLAGTILMIGLAVLLLGFVGASWISARFTRPLRAVTEGAEAVAAGKLDHRLAHAGPADVRRLASAFNGMAERVQQARDDLEARVAQRTVDLSGAMQQLRDAQDELVRKGKLAILGQLAGGVGHELRNPLGVMTNAVFYLEIVLEDASPEVREYLGILRHQVELCEKIIADLLDFSRNRTPVAQAVRLEHVAEAQLARAPLATQVVRDFAPDVPAARVDPVHAGQILHNLVVNAAQAIGDSSGTLTVRTRRHGQTHVRVEVSDTGPGVPPELRERIFEPLFTTKARGIGLGLAVSRQLATMNGGELRLETPSTDGATFSLVLPAVDSA